MDRLNIIPPDPLQNKMLSASEPNRTEQENRLQHQTHESKHLSDKGEPLSL